MKTKHILGIITLLLAGFACSDDKKTIDFALDTNELNVEAVGGTKNVKVSVADDWIATASQPWVKVSPTNGRSSEICTITVDSTLLANEQRTAVVRFATRTDAEARIINITQKGFEHALTLSETSFALANYGAPNERHFDVEVTSNVDFEVVIPNEVQNWLTYEDYHFKLDAGARPRKTTIRFNWEGNSTPEMREAKIEFKVQESDLVHHDAINVSQGRAPEITPDRQGDSLALAIIEEKLNMYSPWNKNEPLEYWTGVDLWDELDPGVTEEKIGRVRAVEFSSFYTQEGIPDEIEYLTELEALSFYDNGNENFQYIKINPTICKLTNLKYLRFYSVGLIELPSAAEFSKLKNLETLVLSSNNFQKLPDVFNNPNNLPKLKHLDLSTNRRRVHEDLTQITDPTDTWGGFYESSNILETLFKWDNLESLQLSNNIIQGSIPEMRYKPQWDGTEFEGDTLEHALPILKEKRVPRVLPHCKVLKINLNYLHGNLPDWLLYHPYLMFWSPETLIFNQNSAPDEQGNKSGFDNIPQSFDYYYEMYPKFKPEY